MSETTSAAVDRRPQHVAAFGFVLQTASFGTLLGISLWSESDAVAAVTRFMAIGLPIWLVLFLVFKQLRAVRAEELETRELQGAQAAGASTAIFELDGEALHLEQDRLRWMIRWLLPSVTVLLSLILLVGHFLGWEWTFADAFHTGEEGSIVQTTRPTLMMWFVVGIGFLCFLYARYAIALARLVDWRLLRAGATCMVGNALACLGLAIALMAGTTFEWAEPLLAYVVRLALFVIGLEFAANFILDFYRPRTLQQLPRPSFDSRLLGLISEPGGIAKSIAEAANYQFGFEVSSTWFYQLLQRWLFPIMVFTLAVVLAMTSVVIVDSDEQAVVERFGRLVEARGASLSPGIHLKLPQPIDVVRRAPVRRLRELVIGEGADHEDEHAHEAVVWTEAHEFVPEMMLLVASPRLDGSPGGPGPVGPGDAPKQASESVAVSLLMVSIPIEYRIKDIEKYLYTYADPEKLMEGLAYQYLSDYAAGVDIDELMGPGRTKFNADLKGAIQNRLDQHEVGIEVVFVGIRDAHPPEAKQVAATFQKVVSAQTNMAATINAARGAAQKILISIAGTEAQAKVLDSAIRARDELQAQPDVDADKLAEANQLVETLLLGDAKQGIAPLSGNAAAQIAQARARASRMISRAAAKVQVFSTEVAAYEAAPALYRQRKELERFEDLGHIRKYLIQGDPSDVIIEYQTAEEAGMDRVLREGLDK